MAKESTAEVIATYGPLQAADCVLRPGPGMGDRTTCGRACQTLPLHVIHTYLNPIVRHVIDTQFEASFLE